MQRVFSLLVDNNPGVLSRVSGLFSRRGYSIDSITAGVTADPRFTRITIVASGDELILSQIEKQVRKLEDVIEIKVLHPEDSVYRELIMVKVRANKTERTEMRFWNFWKVTRFLNLQEQVLPDCREESRM